MSATPYSTSRQPVMPSSGGLMGRSFSYRTAEKTDVRLTWERAKAQLPPPLNLPKHLKLQKQELTALSQLSQSTSTSHFSAVCAT